PRDSSSTGPRTSRPTGCRAASSSARRFRPPADAGVADESAYNRVMRIVLLALTLSLSSGCGVFGSGTTGPSGGGGSGGGGGGNVHPADANMLHNLDALNMYRAANGVAALVIDDQISAFSLTASMDLKQSHPAHAYF